MSAELTLRHTADGTPYVRPYLGTNQRTGRQIRPYKSFPGRTDAEAMELARAWLAEVERFADLGTSALVGDLLDRYVAGLEDGGYSANTIKTYENCARMASAIRGKAFGDVRVRDVEEMYNALFRDKSRGGAGLSASTVGVLHRFLRKAFAWMCTMTGADANPVREASPPRGEGHPAVALEAEGYAKLCDLLDRILRTDAETFRERFRRETAMAAYLALNTGMRCGEACALRRRDVRGAMRPPTLVVCGTVVEARGRVFRQEHTKGKRIRTLAVVPDVLDAIRAHVAWHRSLWGQTSDKRPVVATGPNDFLRPSEVSGEFRALCDEAGIPAEVTFHSLRHTHATWALLNGEAPQVVAARLGHSSPKITLDTYAHLLPASDADLAQRFAEQQRLVREDYED